MAESTSATDPGVRPAFVQRQVLTTVEEAANDDVLDGDGKSEHTLTSTGTYRVSNGQVEAAPRNEGVQAMTPAEEAFIGSTLDDVEQALTAVD